MRRSAASRTEEIHRSLMDLDRETAKFCDQYARHGRQLPATVTSYNDGAAMLSSRGGLGRMVKRVRSCSRRLFKRPEEPRFQAVREAVDQIAQSYGEAATELRKSA